jgi:hypothetical protein
MDTVSQQEEGMAIVMRQGLGVLWNKFSFAPPTRHMEAIVIKINKENIILTSAQKLLIWTDSKLFLLKTSELSCEVKR